VGFQKAERKGIWIRALIGGPSGSGKTYSALRLATGLANACGSRIAAIDTENGRLRYYANEFDFDDLQLEAPFTPEKYINAIQTAVDGGYKVLIIDSISHEWNWCCDTVTAMPGNSFQNWGKVKANFHNKFTEAIIQSPIHIIVTARGKDEYTMEEKDGKKTPKKIGVGIRQEDNTEYEYAATFNLSQDTHVASAMKDNTHIFENRYEVLTEHDGKALFDWANSAGAPSAEKKQPAKPAKATQTVDSVIAEIAAQVDMLKETGVARDDIASAIKNVCGIANFKNITEKDVAVGVLEALKQLGA
jgi:hypothetical protein